MPEDEHHHEEDLTTSTMERWEWLGTLLASAVVLSLPTILIGAALGSLGLSPIGQSWFLLYSTVVLMATTWVFGKDTLKAVRKSKGD